ncbi:hypothetical protein V6N11_029209 [Hibiscus sabdariffa]|uniref:Uncharacterized protein n=1 Tax=Hibiscus sabdariffa TaxID=183260 RepID=A0ABR1ZB29_9ROSI
MHYLLNQPPLSTSVAAMLTVFENWDWRRLSDMLREVVLDKIVVFPPHAALGRDLSRWRWNDSRIFLTHSAYKVLSINLSNGANGFWKYVWHIYVPQSVEVFL